MSARTIARPEVPRTSVTTPVILMLASSKTFWRRNVPCPIRCTSCVRARVRSRICWIGAGGTKLPRTSPNANNSASHAASDTSLLRPGRLRTSRAFTKTSANRSSKMCHTGFQYTPVASITTSRIRHPSSQSPNRNSSSVVVPNRSVTCSSLPRSTTRTAATTSSLCTSSPAHRP